MKEGWEYIDFKDVFPVKMGKTPPRSDKSSWDENKETHNKWVSIADISNNEGKIIEDTKEYISDTAAEKINKVSKGSLLMSFKLSIGRMAFAGDDLYTNEAIIAIPESNKYILRFIYYYLLSYNWLSLTEGNEKVKGATLNKSSIGKIQLPVLDLSEQQSIVDYLDSAFAKIDAMKANAEKALGEAKALFQASLKEMLEPKEGWEEKTLKETAKYRRGSFPQPYGNREWYDGKGSMPFVQVAELQEDSFDLIPVTKRRISNLAQPLSVFVPAGTVLVSLQGSIGKVAITNYDSFVDRTVAIFQDYKIEIDKTFFAYQLKRRFEIERLKARGTTIKTITKEEFANFSINCPPLSEQQSIVTALDSLKSKVDRLQENFDKMSQECDALKQAILRNVFE